MKTCAVRNSVSVIRLEVSIVLAVIFALALPARLPAQTRTNLAGSVTSESMTALWVARDRGLFKKHGLDMQYILMPRNPLAVAALLAGEIDAAIVGPGHAVNAASSGADIIGIANLAQKLDYRLVARPEVKNKEDLRGKRIAISGPGSPGEKPMVRPLLRAPRQPLSETGRYSDLLAGVNRR
jgi:ABC-type nitrate/sulfonate/bicarbonate transport system substrate-binding protein